MKAEGIIKQICKKYISNDALSYEAKNVAYHIEQDLIAEIKKQIPDKCPCSCPKPGHIKKELIGEE